ncbi:MAG: PLDc N-terminal domain-containing protein [Candidatus Omnitrophota bacterium]
MDIWALGTYIFLLLCLAIGAVSCWRSSLPFSQKLFWTVVITVLPLAGTLSYFFFAKETRELLS